MSKYIPINKMKQLREAAKNGDELAKKILKAQLNDIDFNDDLDSYFAPKENHVETSVIQEDNNITKEEPSNDVDPGLAQFLEDNGVKKGDAEYNDFVEDYYREYPKARPNISQEEKPVVEEETIPNQEVQEVQEEVNPKSEVQEVQEEQEVSPKPEVQEEVDLTKDIAQQLINVITSCDKAMVLILNNDEIEETTLKGAMTTLQEIKNDILNNFDKIKKVKKALCEKKEEKEEESIEQPAEDKNI